jgi:hypothetical protein
MTISSFILVTPLFGLDGGGALPVGSFGLRQAASGAVRRPLPHPWNLGRGLSIGRIAGLFCIIRPEAKPPERRRRKRWPGSEEKGYAAQSTGTKPSSPMAAEPVTIKKYANRRLYNTGTST